MGERARWRKLCWVLWLCVPGWRCTHDPASSAAEGAGDVDSGALFGLAIMRGGEDVCVLEVVGEDGKRRDSGPAAQVTGGVRMELEAGKYKVLGPKCGEDRPKVKGRRPVAFTVQSGKLSYLGDLAFRVDGEACYFRYGAAGGKDDAPVEAKAADAPSLLKRLEEVPKARRSSIVSGYTGKKVVKGRKETKTHVFEDQLRVAPLASLSGTAWNPKSIVLDECWAEERKSNPLAVGEWKLTVYFQDGEFSNLDEKKGQAHVFSAKFADCVRAKAKAHRPGVPEYVVYEIKL